MNSLLLQVSANAPGNTGDGNLGDIIILVVAALIIVGVCWPSLRENNIFQKVRLYNYGRGEDAKIYVRHRQRDTLIFCIGANIGGLVLLIHQAIRIKTLGIYYHVTPMDRLPLRFFLLSLFCTVCLFVFSFVGEVELDLIRNFKYSLKVWITSIFISPLLFFTLYSYKIANAGYLFYLCCKTVVMVSGIGSITFGALVFATHCFTAKPLKMHSKRLCILLITQAVILLNLVFAAILIHPNINWLTGWLIFTVIMGLSIRYYDMDTTIYSDVAFYEAEVVE